MAAGNRGVATPDEYVTAPDGDVPGRPRADPKRRHGSDDRDEQRGERSDRAASSTGVRPCLRRTRRRAAALSRAGAATAGAAAPRSRPRTDSRAPAASTRAGAPPRQPPAAAAGRAGWGWGLSLAGLAVGFGPEALLYAAALGTGTSTSVGKVTIGSAVALVIGSLVVYGWQTLAAWFFSLRVAGSKLALWGFTTPNKAFFWTIPVALAAVYVVSFLHDLVVHPKQQDILGEFPRTPPASSSS